MAKQNGRPRITIDAEQFKKLCNLQCTLAEIAGFFSCSEDTIERWCVRELGETFADAFKKHSAGGRASLRRYQFNLAKVNATMAIWLGKQWLGQEDKRIVDGNLTTSTIIDDIPKAADDGADN